MFTSCHRIVFCGVDYVIYIYNIHHNLSGCSVLDRRVVLIHNLKFGRCGYAHKNPHRG